MHEFIINLLKDLLYVVLITTIPVVAKHFTDYLASKKKTSSATSDSVLLDKAKNNAIDTIQKAVDTVSQTFVNSLKASGNFDKDAQEKAFNDAAEVSKKLIGEESAKLLSSAYGDLDEWIKVQIESYILGKKS